jgi:7-carboxy-7-deazaguanine synthase
VSYALKELFYTLQGEGVRAGRAAVFARFAGCNLWSGREQDRATATCWFCDTDFVGTDGPGGGRFATPEALAGSLRGCWDEGCEGGGAPYVVFTGGEPMLQLDEPLVEACHAVGFEVAIETNGTLAVPEGVDWVCVSPKPGAELVQRRGDELKVVYPGGVEPDSLDGLDFDTLLIQPMDGPEGEANVRAATEFCLRQPRWRLSVQLHKVVGIP